jgi:hypothetical protein
MIKYENGVSKAPFAYPLLSLNNLTLYVRDFESYPRDLPPDKLTVVPWR